MNRQFEAFHYRVVNKAEDALDIFIDGEIVDAETQEIYKKWYGLDTSVSYKSFRDEVVKAKPKKLNIYVNSGGGIVTDAMAIHDFLLEQSEQGVEVNTEGRGIVASAATYILMAGGKRSKISKNSWFMIHNVQGFAWGDVEDIENYAKVLRKFNNTVAQFYAEFTGISESEILDMMSEETWMSAEEAVNNNFVKKLTAKAEIKNIIKPEHWQFKNMAVLNAYNAEASRPQDEKAFFENLFNNQFMKFFDMLKEVIGTAKKSDKFKDVQGRDEMLDMMHDVFAPMMNKVDEALAAKVIEIPVNVVVKDPKENSGKDGQAEETKPEETTTTPEETETIEQENPEITALKVKLQKQEKEMADLRKAAAKAISKSSATEKDPLAEVMSNVVVEYGN